jgi:hypothetical protein
MILLHIGKDLAVDYITFKVQTLISPSRRLLN